MSNLQVKNVPDTLYGRLRDYAAESNLTIGAVVLEAVERELAKAEMVKRLALRSPVELTSSVADVIHEARMFREEQIAYYGVEGGPEGGARPESSEQD